MSSDTSTVGGIQGNLLKLHSLLGDTENRNAALVCHDIIGDLGQECMITKNHNELGKNFLMQKAVRCVFTKNAKTKCFYLFLVVCLYLIHLYRIRLQWHME